jgi:RimJ/RimL family protein N-acetyltransferase
MAVRERSTQVGGAGWGSPALSGVTHPRAPHIPLSSRRVRLRAVVPSDYEFLFQLAADERSGRRWRYRGLPPRPDEFARDLWQGVLVQFLVEHVQTHERLGLVVAYGESARDRRCHIAAVFREEARVWPLEAVALFVNFLFVEFGFRKLYAEMTEYNLEAFRSAVGRWMDCEGVLEDHEFHGGRYWDLYILALWRDRFDRDAERLLARITRELPS